MKINDQIREWVKAHIDARFAETERAILQDFAGVKAVLSDLAGASQFSAIQAAGWAARAERIRAEMMVTSSDRAVKVPADYADSLKHLQGINAGLYPLWFQLFENGARAYSEERLGSCSHRDHKYALLFGCYLEIYGHGRILDIGCGPYACPSYLATRRPDLTYGLEPLPLKEAPRFEVQQGFNEFIPWADEQFDTVVSGTSLDHVLSLRRSFEEVVRVLRPDGRYIVWLASVPGAKAFDEAAPEPKAIDQFHLFHFDRNWIEPIFEEFFYIEDVTVTPQPGFDHLFYSLRKKVQTPAQ